MFTIYLQILSVFLAFIATGFLTLFYVKIQELWPKTKFSNILFWLGPLYILLLWPLPWSYLIWLIL